MFLGPMRGDPLPVPLVVQVVGITRQQRESSGVGVNCQTLVEVPVVDLLGLAVVVPGTLDHAHLAPSDAHPVHGLRLHTPLSVG